MRHPFVFERFLCSRHNTSKSGTRAHSNVFETAAAKPVARNAVRIGMVLFTCHSSLSPPFISNSALQECFNAYNPLTPLFPRAKKKQCRLREMYKVKKICRKPILAYFLCQAQVTHGVHSAMTKMAGCQRTHNLWVRTTRSTA